MKAKRATMYLHLFHGRDFTDQDMNDQWGFDGPVLRIEGFHVTYMSTFRVGISERVSKSVDWEELNIVDGLLCYDGKFYGDWSILAEGTDPELVAQAEDIDMSKLTPRVTPPVEEYQDVCARLVFEWYGVNVDEDVYYSEDQTPEQFAVWYGEKYGLERMHPKR